MGGKREGIDKTFPSDPGLNSLKVPYPKFLPTLTNSLSVVSKCLNAQ